MEIILNHQPEARARLLKALEAFAAEHQLPAKVVQAADLALEEHLANVFKHGYADDPERQVQVSFHCAKGRVQIEVADDAPPFNPLNRPPVDTTIPLEQRPVGGLGVHLMRQFMDSLEYRREGGRNILHMSKRLDG